MGTTNSPCTQALTRRGCYHTSETPTFQPSDGAHTSGIHLEKHKANVGRGHVNAAGGSPNATARRPTGKERKRADGKGEGVGGGGGSRQTHAGIHAQTHAGTPQV